MSMGIFPEDSAARKEYPIFSGLLQYFPSALAAIAHHSFKGNKKHNPGLPLHHDRAKSDDEPDALGRHLMEGDYVGMAWRALSLLQKHCEAQGAPVAPAARNVAGVAQDDQYLTNSETAAGHRERWKAERDIKKHRVVIPKQEINAYLADFGPNPLSAFINRADDPAHPLHHMTLDVGSGV